MVLPLTPLRRISLKRPLPAGDSLVVCQVIRRRPVSEFTSPTVVEPCPCQDPTTRVTATIDWDVSGFERHPSNATTENTENTESTKAQDQQRFAAPAFGRRRCPKVMPRK
jgi:hypothetical protein